MSNKPVKLCELQPLLLVAAGLDPSQKIELLKAVIKGHIQQMEKCGVDLSDETDDSSYKCFFEEHEQARLLGWRLFEDVASVVLAGRETADRQRAADRERARMN